MIATDRFTFVHLHKSGGSFVSELLLRYVGSARRIGYHYPLAILPAEYRGLPVLGCVRNPWDFYVSYYFFQAALLEAARARISAMSRRELEDWTNAGNDPFNGVDVLFDELSEGGSLGFERTTRRILRLGQDDRLLDQLLGKMPVTLDRRGRRTPPQREGFRGMNVRADDLAAIRGTGEGLYTFLFRHLHGDDPRGVHFLKMESLREDLLAYLRARSSTVTSEMVSFVRGAEPVNTSRHRPYPSYYDEELAALVRDRDGGLAERFGYRFDGALASR
jgi:hypothetical protein